VWTTSPASIGGNFGGSITVWEKRQVNSVIKW